MSLLFTVSIVAVTRRRTLLHKPPIARWLSPYTASQRGCETMSQDPERRIQAVRRLAEDRGATAGEKAAARDALRRLRAGVWFRSRGQKPHALVGRRSVQVSMRPEARPRLGQERVEVVEGLVSGVVFGTLTLLLATMPVSLLDLGQQSTLAVGAATWFAFDIAIIAGWRRLGGSPLVARGYIYSRLTFVAILVLVLLLVALFSD